MRKPNWVAAVCTKAKKIMDCEIASICASIYYKYLCQTWPLFSQGCDLPLSRTGPSCCHFGSWGSPDILLYCQYRVVLYRPFRHGSIPPVWVNPFVRALPGLGASCNSRMCCWDFCCSRQMTLWQPPALIGETLLASAWELISTPLTQWSCQAQLIIFLIFNIAIDGKSSFNALDVAKKGKSFV